MSTEEKVTAPNDDGGLHELLPLSPPVFHILLALGDEVLHGYAIMRRFTSLTGGADQLLPGTLYATLARMVETGVLEEVEAPDPHVDSRRRHYRVTDFGRGLARAESRRMGRLLGLAERQGLLADPQL